MLSQIYHFHVYWQSLFYALAFVVPIFYYMPLIYILYKHELQEAVFFSILVAALVNLVCSLILIPKMGIDGSLLAAGIAQLILAGLYTFFTQRVSATAVNEKNEFSYPDKGEHVLSGLFHTHKQKSA